MPHIILEYSRNLGDIIEVSRFVHKLHKEMPQHGIEADRLKTRAIECNYSAVGEEGTHGHMLHATLLLLEGRDVPEKKKYGEVILKMMKDAVGDRVKHCQITLEIRDMAADTYFK
ncbi:MAG: hypothetical protein GC137_06935 [Alphaproteobacteria bacterium]|nr:hypothetical protein [Alphaproteobacteria bacterium]